MIAQQIANHIASDPTIQFLADDINTSTGRTWLRENIVPLIVLGIALVVGGGALSRNVSKVIITCALMVVFLVVVGVSASTGAQNSLGSTFLSFFGIRV